MLASRWKSSGCPGSGIGDRSERITSSSWGQAAAPLGPRWGAPCAPTAAVSDCLAARPTRTTGRHKSQDCCRPTQSIAPMNGGTARESGTTGSHDLCQDWGISLRAAAANGSNAKRGAQARISFACLRSFLALDFASELEALLLEVV
eukprot:947538-Rhodomonas_salina.1